MKITLLRRFGVAQILLGAAIVFALFVAREAKAGDEQDHQQLVTDWSHRHVLYSEPHSLMKRYQLSMDTRYAQQVRRKNAERRHIGREEWRWYHAPEDPHSLKGDWSMNMGTGATVGAGNYPAKYTFSSTTASCAADFVVYNTSQAGSGSQASIVAFNNIYAVTCGATIPTTYWAYNTGAGAVVTSPVLSFDGKQVAFIQNTAGASNLVVLRWKASDGTLAAPVTPGVGPCLPAAAPCQSTVALSTATVASNANISPTFTCTGVDSHSSPYYDYAQDILYVGDNSGCLHKFVGVFLGTPTEVVSTSLPNVWPAALTGGFGYLNSPIAIDQALPNANEVLITGSDGEIYAVDTTIGGVYPTGTNFIDPKMADPGFDDSPLVDVTTGKMYLFARASSAFIGGGTFPGTPGVPSVFEIAIPATPADIHAATYIQGVVSDAGAAIPSAPMYVGTFDDLYYTNANSGFMYTCSTHNTGTATVNALWVIAVDAGVMDPTTIGLGAVLTTANVGCSPITEFNNGNTNNDRIFLSVTGSPVTVAPISCPSALTGCIMSFDTDSILTVAPPASTTSAKASAAGGTSGIVVDNASASGGASQVYFTPLADQACVGAGGVGTGTGGCAIQASQSGLN